LAFTGKENWANTDTFIDQFLLEQAHRLNFPIGWEKGKVVLKIEPYVHAINCTKNIQMKALLLIAHGSRKQSSNDEVALLAERVKAQPSEFEAVTHCFLELTEPRVPSAIDQLIVNGATEITILPYFLAAGYHVAEDLPKLLEEAKIKFPQTQFTMLEHLGAADLMPQWILQQTQGQ